MDKRDEYVFDGLDPVAEYNMLNGRHTDYYRGAGNHLALMHQYKGGTQGQMYWYHYNNKGDVAGLTKHNGNSHHTYRYDPYGAVLPENGNFTDPHNHYTLTGKEFDENTGLVWFGARHYEPETGVWMGQDTYRGRLNDPASLHRFMYVGDNPVTFWDWYGYEIRVYSSRAFGIKGLNHAFVWSTEVEDGIGTNGSVGFTLGNGVGDLGSEYSVVEDLNGMTEAEFIEEIKNYPGWNQSLWIPYAGDINLYYANIGGIPIIFKSDDGLKGIPDILKSYIIKMDDCHSQLSDAFDYVGVEYPGAPYGRVDDEKVVNTISTVSQVANNMLYDYIFR